MVGEGGRRGWERLVERVGEGGRGWERVVGERVGEDGRGWERVCRVWERGCVEGGGRE